MASGRGGIERTLSKLRISVDEGKYYEAHQMYRTLIFRYESQNRILDAANMAYEGARHLLEHKQYGSGADLALIFIKILQKLETSNNNIERVSVLYGLLHPESVERMTYRTSSVKWTINEDQTLGHPVLHQKFATILWKEKNYSMSRYHFLRSRDGEGFATMLIEYNVTKGFPSEADLFIAQAVLQYLCLRNKSTATVTFYAYTRQHPSVKQSPPFPLPLLNFIWFLLIAIEGGKLAVFTILCEQYHISINRDPIYKEYLDRIGQIFFGVIPPQQNAQGSILDNIMKSLLGDEDEESYNDSPNISNTSRTNPLQLRPVDLD